MFAPHTQSLPLAGAINSTEQTTPGFTHPLSLLSRPSNINVTNVILFYIFSPIETVSINYNRANAELLELNITEFERNWAVLDNICGIAGNDSARAGVCVTVNSSDTGKWD